MPFTRRRRPARTADRIICAVLVVFAICFHIGCEDEEPPPNLFEPSVRVPGPSVPHVQSTYGRPQIAVFTYDVHAEFHGLAGSRPVFLAIYEDGTIIWSKDGEAPFSVGQVSLSVVDSVIEELRTAGTLARAEAGSRIIWPNEYAFYDIIAIKWGGEELRLINDPMMDYLPSVDAAWTRIREVLLALPPEDEGVEDESISFSYMDVPPPPRDDQ